MDTGSHLLLGATLAGLAMLDPIVAGQSELAHAVLVAAMVGSHAPDFDTLARLKGYSAYIRYHRGVTHSLPALLIWPLLISLPAALLFHVTDSLAHLYFWTMLAVILHVFLDLCNAYGVQCFRPINEKWHHFDILALFDPFLFVLHLSGLLIWLLSDVNAGYMFLGIYAVTFLYIGVRALQHARLVCRVREFFSEDGICHVVPSLHWFRWQFVLETRYHFYTGKIDYGRVKLLDVYNKGREHPAAQATLGTDGVRAFLHFAQRVHVSIMEMQNGGYEVHWRDMRFWHDHKLPFGVDVTLDHDMQVLKQTLGWRKRVWDPPYV